MPPTVGSKSSRPKKVKGITFRTRKLDKIIAEMPRLGSELVETVATDVRAGAESSTTRVETGAMRAGWRARQLGRLTWRIENTEFYARFHEYGTTVLSPAPMLGPAVRAARRRLRGLAKGLFRG